MSYTVLILGAGSSQPYGFPLGGELKNDVVKELKEAVASNSPGKPLHWALMAFEPKKPRQFADRLPASAVPSVDTFLQDNPDFLHLGKIAIAGCLMKHEDKDTLYGRPRDWYQYLFNTLARPGQWDRFCLKEEFAIITYNYDRSLEQYFFSALQNKYGKRDEEVALAMKRLPIIHLHGQLGYLPWQAHNYAAGFESFIPSCGQYSPELSYEAIIEAAEGIFITHEMEEAEKDRAMKGPHDAMTLLVQKERKQVVKRAHETLSKATDIYFLGFGYEARNLARLELAKHIQGKKVNIYCNCFNCKRFDRLNVSWRFNLLAHQLRKLCDVQIRGLAEGTPERDILAVFENDFHLNSLGH